MGRAPKHVIFAGALTLLATAALAADSWSDYRNAEWGFSVETPTAPNVKVESTSTAAGAVPTLVGTMDLGEQGALIFTVGDYRKVPSIENADPNKGLEGGVQGAINNAHATLDSENALTVSGAPARDVIAHTDQYVLHIRLVFKGGRIYGAIGAGASSAGVPAAYQRFAGSLRVD